MLSVPLSSSVNKKGKERKKRTIYKRYGKLMLIISAATHAQISAHFDCQPRGQIEAKNKGPMEMYFLERLKPQVSANPDSLMRPTV